MKVICESNKENEVSIEEWTEDLNNEVISKNDPKSAAGETLGSISYDLGVKFLLPLFIGNIK